jgi:signal transduction histidine kinase
VEHVDPAKVKLARELQQRYPPREGELVASTLQSRKPLLLPAIDRELLRSRSYDDEHFRIVEELGLRSAIVVPLAATDHVIGTLTLVTSESGRTFDEEDLRFADDLARRAALSIENARLYTEAQQANRAKDEFLATVSHELRTPLTAVLGWARVLRMGADPGTAREAVEAIERSAAAQAQLIEDILDISRIRVGKLRFRSEPVDLPPVVEAAVEMVRPAAEQKQLSLQVELERDLPAISGDPTRLQQIVWNLLTNAVKFTPPSGRITVTLRAKDALARLCVSDTGSGIPPEFLPHLFERFSQAETSTTRSAGGLGLGLSIVRHLVELHGGVIHAESAGEGKGATFVVEIPLAATEETAAAREAARGLRASDELPSFDGLHFLVVEDNPDTLNLIAHILERAGGTVRRATSVSEALGQLAEARPDAMLSDIAMPGRDGFELIRSVREADEANGTHLPALAVTASGTAGDRERALSAGFDDYLRKPVEPRLLLRSVAAVLASNG